MSSLISAEDLLRLFAFGGKPPTYALHETGVDLEVLDAAFKTVKPDLNFFSRAHFFSLEDSFKFFWKDDEPWRTWFEAAPANSERFKQVIILAYIEIVDEKGHRVKVRDEGETDPARYWWGYLRVYLTKRGEWIVWTNNPTSRFEVVSSPRKAMKTAYEMLGEGQDFSSNRFGQDAWPKPRTSGDHGYQFLASLPMEVAAQLIVEYEKHVEEREKRLNDSKDNQVQLRKMIDAFDL